LRRQLLPVTMRTMPPSVASVELSPATESSSGELPSRPTCGLPNRSCRPCDPEILLYGRRQTVDLRLTGSRLEPCRKQ
jgi:hypothetical protein